MNITKIDTTSFKSKNKTIRFADDVARKVNTFCPRISTTLLDGLKNSKNPKFSNSIQNLSNKTALMRMAQMQSFLTAANFKDILQSIVLPVKSLKVGNCFESALLSMLVAKANGINNCEMRGLITPDNRRYDHAIVYVSDKKPYIIDSWLGFADYVPKAIERYKKEFRQYYDFEIFNTEKMLCAKYSKDFKLINFVNKNFTEEELKILKRTFPQILLKFQK